MISYLIAETFHSIQGEGTWTGTPMFFIRLAGCNVGRYLRPEALQQGPLRVLRKANINQSICTTFDGEEFLCDTDYHTHKSLTIAELVFEKRLIPDTRICLTGGEPFLPNRNVALLLEDLSISWPVHIETSGTLAPERDLLEVLLNCHDRFWITCSPKKGFHSNNLPFINEFKILVSKTTNLDNIRQFQESLSSTQQTAPIYLQPIDWLSPEENHLSLVKTLNLAQLGGYRMSVQAHKYLKLP